MTTERTRYVILSTAVARLEAGMYGGFRRPLAIAPIKKEQPGLSVGWSLWREQAASYLRQAALAGEIDIHVMADSDFTGQRNESAKEDQHSAYGAPARMPPCILAGIVTSRGGLPDGAIRIDMSELSIRSSLTDALRARLADGCLVVEEEAFNAWYINAREKGRWPSQTQKRGPRRGRPSKQSDQLRRHIIVAIDGGHWEAGCGIMALYRWLQKQYPEARVPSHDTLGRFIDKLFQESGDPRLHRKRRRRRISDAR